MTEAINSKLSHLHSIKDNYRFSTNIEINDLAYKIIDNITEGIVITDSKGRIEWANPAVVDITGYSIEELIGNNPSLFKSDKHDKKFYENMWNVLKSTGEWKGEIWNRRKTGEAYPEHIHIMSIKNRANDFKYIAVFNDLTQTKKNRKYMEYNANYDFLTDLPNRFLLNDRLESAISQAIKTNHKVGLIFIDLDRFKRINDGLGHNTGDRLLKEVSYRIKDVLGENQTLARMGSDQFVILDPLVEKEEFMTLAKKLKIIFSEPFTLENYTVYMTSSIGISIFPDDGITKDMLIKNAEAAMRISKNIPGNKFTLYNSDMNNLSKEKIVIENDIRRGIEEREFRLFYQPKIDTNTGEITGVEALIRWHHPLKGFLTPFHFIQIAEDTGLIEHLGEWVLREAIRQQKEWISKGYYFGPVSINLSPKQLKSYKVKEEMLEIIDKSEIDYNLIEFEITETAAIESEKITLDLMNTFTDLGIKFSIDDFGTGYSSLSYLIKLPFDTIKIDKSFIDNMSKGDNGIEIVKGIIAMAHSLNMKVIAEGVENKRQLDVLRTLDCDMIQGYYYSPPISARKIEKIYGIK